jgi:hypothetical protein
VHLSLPFTDTPNTDTPDNAKNLTLLLEHNAAIGDYDNNGMTPLQWAGARGQKHCLKVLCRIYKSYSDKHPEILRPVVVVGSKGGAGIGGEKGGGDGSAEAVGAVEKDEGDETNKVKRDQMEMRGYNAAEAAKAKTGIISGTNVLNINHIETQDEGRSSMHFAALFGQSTALQVLKSSVLFSKNSLSCIFPSSLCGLTLVPLIITALQVWSLTGICLPLLTSFALFSLFLLTLFSVCFPITCLLSHLPALAWIGAHRSRRRFKLPHAG